MNSLHFFAFFFPFFFAAFFFLGMTPHLLSLWRSGSDVSLEDLTASWGLVVHGGEGAATREAGPQKNGSD
jgi:hypothetical protein